MTLSKVSNRKLRIYIKCIILFDVFITKGNLVAFVFCFVFTFLYIFENLVVIQPYRHTFYAYYVNHVYHVSG